MAKKMSTAELRRHNRGNVYQYFYAAQEPKTKQDVAHALSLSLPTVTQNLRDLMDAGLLAYAGLEDSTGGRRARTMQAVAGARFSLGVEISPTQLRLAAIDLRATEIAYQCLPVPFRPNAQYRAQFAAGVEGFLDAFALDRSRLLGVGVTLPGVIDEKRGIVEAAPVLRLHQMELSLLTGPLPYPLFVQNDASAGGYAEWWNRSGPSSLAYLFLGKGVGGALLIDGKPYPGAHWRGGEFGHMSIVPDGRLCSCGQRGCLEAYCSASRLTDDLGLQIDEFFRGLHAGNLQYAAIWKEYLHYLALGVNTIRMALDCDVVLGGAVASYLEESLPALRAELHARNSFHDDGQYLHLGKSQAKANCIGVALHFVDAFLQNL